MKISNLRIYARQMFRANYLALAGSVLALNLCGFAAQAQDTVTLRMSAWLPPTHNIVSKVLPAWIEEIEVASGGTLKIQFDPAPLAAPPAQYDVVRDGVADMAYHVVGYTPGPFEILRGVELPFVSPNATAGSQAAFDWYDRNIGFDEEFDDVKVVTLMVAGPGHIHTKEHVATLEDLQGVKLRAGGGGVRISEALGATPVAVPAPATYETIQKGVADGVMFPYSSIPSFRLDELVKYHLEVPGGIYTSVFAILMNRDKYESLSDEHKKVLDELGGIEGARILGQGMDADDAEGVEHILANGGMITSLSGEELDIWKKTLAFMTEEWFATAGDAGLDGPALYEDLLATVKKYAQ